MKPVYALLSVDCNEQHQGSKRYDLDGNYESKNAMYLLTSEYNVDIVVSIILWS